MNHKTDMREALQLCIDAMLHDGVPTDPEHPKRIALNAAEAALASRPDAQAKTGATGWKLAMRVMQSDLFDKLDDAERAECDALVRANPYLGRSSTAAAQVDERGAFQSRVQPWMLACFGAEIAADTVERNHRFFEEAAELVQSCGMTASEAHQLVDYTWSRPVGEKTQEVGGVMVTLAALCLANGLDMHAAGETELARISDPETMAKIRAKQAAKPKHSPLPEARAAAPQAARDQHEKSDLYKEGYLAGKAAAAAPSPDREQVGEESRELGYAQRLVTSVWEKHYKTKAPNWKPLPDMMGILTQIDNMLSGMAPKVDASPSRECEQVGETPEGCTSADAEMLRAANHSLAAEIDLLKRRLRPFAQLASSPLSWAMVEYCVKDDPEKQTLQAPQMQRAFNRAADALSDDASPSRERREQKGSVQIARSHFDAAYKRACASSQPDDWMHAALMAQQLCNAMDKAASTPTLSGGDGATFDYDDVVSICDAHGIVFPVDCIEMVVEIVRHALLQPQAAEPKGLSDERAEFLAYWCEEVPDYMREKWKENVDQCLQDGNATEKLSAAWDAWQARALLAKGKCHADR